MSGLAFKLIPPVLELAAHDQVQLGYVLLSVYADGDAARRAVNWALVADASRSMRIPIVGEAEFRDLVRRGGAQEMLVDGVPVWQLSGPVPPDIRARAPSALDHVARALHSIVERLDNGDRFALIACAEHAELLVPTTPGDGRVALVHGIGRLKSLELGEETDLAEGMRVALQQLEAGRAPGRVDRLILLTDGFTRDTAACEQLARRAAAAGVSVSTLGLGSEFQEQLLTTLADLSGGRASFVRKAERIPPAVDRELEAARAVAGQAVEIDIRFEPGVELRRLTRVRPTLTALSPEQRGEGWRSYLGDLERGVPQIVLLEALVPPQPAGSATLGRVTVYQGGVRAAQAGLTAQVGARAGVVPPNVLDAAARANVAALQQRAATAAAAGDVQEAARLWQAAAHRLVAMGEEQLAAAARAAATNALRTGQIDRLATKELTYATRRLGE